jgi:crotonobetainyl-CoA:carnitine CoA-transferase CaiB-like acyl-CoA transferase
VRNRRDLIPLLDDLFQRDEINHWLSILGMIGIPCGPINSIDQVMDDPQVHARDMVVDVGHPSAGSIKMVASPLNIPTAQPVVRFPPPLLGEHTAQILHELLGMDDKSVIELREAQVI